MASKSAATTAKVEAAAAANAAAAAEKRRLLEVKLGAAEEARATALEARADKARPPATEIPLKYFFRKRCAKL